MLRKCIEKYNSLPIPVKASLWFLACSFFQKGLSTMTTPIFTRILTSAEYGQFGVFNSWMSIISPIVCLNLASGVFSQGLVKFEDDRNRFASSLQGLCLTLVLLWSIIYVAGQDFWNNLFSLNTVQGIAMMVMIWSTCVFSFWSLDKRVDFKYKKIVILTVLVSVIQPVFCIYLILNSDDKVTARILGIAIIQGCFYAPTFIIQMIKGKSFFSKEYWLYALRFNLPLLPHYLSMYVLSSSDRIMISNMAGDAQAGIYNLAHSLALIMTMLNTALLQTIEPWIYRKLKEKRAMDIAKVAYPCFTGVAVVNLLLILFAPELIVFFAPTEYKEAVWVIPGLALSVYFMFLYTFFATFEFYYEKKAYIVGATMGGAVLNIALNYIFIQIFGYIAAGYTTMFSYIMFAVLHYYFGRRVCKEYLDNIKPYNLRIVLGISIGVLISGLSMLLVYQLTVIRYLMIFCLFLLIFIKRNKIIKYVRVILETKKD